MEDKADALSPESNAGEKRGMAYNDPSWWYDIRGFFILMSTYQVMLWTHLAFFAKNLGKKHLEAAIGSGTFLALTLLTCKVKNILPPDEIIGIDYAERMLAGAKRLFKNRKGIQLIQADLTNVDYPDNYFDSVNIAHSFHAFPEPEKVLKELHRVMKPGAKLYVDVLLHPRGGRFRQWLATKVNKFCYRKGILARTCDELETRNQFLRHDFDLEDSYVKGNTFHLIATKNQA